MNEDKFVPATFSAMKAVQRFRWFCFLKKLAHKIKEDRLRSKVVKTKAEWLRRRYQGEV